MRDTSLLSGERPVAPTLAGINYWQKWRYNQTAPYIKNKTVIDLGCGIGHGSYIMSQWARLVWGVDDSPEAIKYAKEHYANRDKISYVCKDVLELGTHPSVGIPFDWVVAFEIIEHIEDTQAVFRKMAGLASQIILSVPDASTPVKDQKFHYRHFTTDEVRKYLSDIDFEVTELTQPSFGNGLAIMCVAKKI